MTDNQFNQLFELVTKSVTSVQRLEEGQKRLEGNISELKSDVSELKSDVSELKEGQKRIEKEVRLNTLAVNEVMIEHFRLKVRVDEMEKLAA